MKKQSQIMQILKQADLAPVRRQSKLDDICFAHTWLRGYLSERQLHLK